MTHFSTAITRCRLALMIKAPYDLLQSDVTVCVGSTPSKPVVHRSPRNIYKPWTSFLFVYPALFKMGRVWFEACRWALLVEVGYTYAFVPIPAMSVLTMDSSPDWYLYSAPPPVSLSKACTDSLSASFMNTCLLIPSTWIMQTLCSWILKVACIHSWISHAIIRGLEE